MSEPDELYTLRAQYWLGHYNLCLEEARQAARRPMAPHLKSEREEMMLRAQLALGQFDKVIAEGSGSSSPALQALALHASFLSFPSDSPDKSMIVDSLKVLLAQPESAGNTSLQLTACHIFMQADLLREALQCVHHGLTMEHLAMCVQIYLKIDRLDLANDSLNLLKQADEDSVLAQLCGAYLAIAHGRSRSDDAAHILSGLSEQYGPSVMLLNCLAAANMVSGKYDAAEANLKEALSDEFGGEKDADALVNIVVCGQHLGRGEKDLEQYLSVLKAMHANHPFVRGFLQVEAAFDRESNKYQVTA
mmetsp:Transcript_15361/g.32323  ORF Transcript_15361/g.32323 Transcript_15361/m.32323 type:complete len:305 (-) Transcript_15361:269-1183(-)|eukprot:CAMPEP_0171339984 /NCGR_PEP_ID=MMETSP0878-20121228/8276_1 /TAXON_ID=67004 /ORGANISM="Thalassiosira weissflogii, Strain CCMP1336" /LENGTH=304 /DNA_ID=CAMNT_0011841977 /DNA_START=52 /DNA_END=966 /DNA_ORIENTATION=+